GDRGRTGGRDDGRAGRARAGGRWGPGRDARGPGGTFAHGLPAHRPTRGGDGRRGRGDVVVREACGGKERRAAHGRPRLEIGRELGRAVRAILVRAEGHRAQGVEIVRDL